MGVIWAHDLAPAPRPLGVVLVRPDGKCWNPATTGWENFDPKFIQPLTPLPFAARNMVLSIAPPLGVEGVAYVLYDMSQTPPADIDCQPIWVDEIAGPYLVHSGYHAGHS